jgi:hypothetical protein
MGTPLLKANEMVDLLPKEQLAHYLGVAPSRRVTKAQLAEQLGSRLEIDAGEMARFLERFKHEVAFGPWDVEQILECTSTERKRWTADGKLPVLAYREFRKAARDIPYPIFDRREILGIAAETVEQWRNEHRSFVQLRRKTGAHKAVASRKAHQQARTAAAATWETMVAVWTSQGSSELAAVLQLAYWTAVVSRWAKVNREKLRGAVKYGERYVAREQAWYEHKNRALQLLLQTPYARVSFYRPEDPDKISFTLCDQCDEDRREMRMSRWEYFSLFGTSVSRCPHCTVEREREYYSLFFLEITTDAFPGLRFAYHTPYPIGKRLGFPRPGKLRRVDHSDAEQEGLFRFGRSLLEEEKIIYREQDVQRHFEAAVAEFLCFFPPSQTAGTASLPGFSQDSPDGQSSMNRGAES